MRYAMLNNMKFENVGLIDEADRLCGPLNRVKLTWAERLILVYLLNRTGARVERQAMLDTLWADVSPRRTVDVLICRLRKKIASTGAPIVITTLYGVGYHCEIVTL